MGTLRSDCRDLSSQAAAHVLARLYPQGFWRSVAGQNNRASSLRRMPNRVVYDSDHGRTTCPECQRFVSQCRCSQQAAPTTDGIARVRREVRRGKPMTVVLGLPLGDADLRTLGKALKKKCSSGGSVKDGQIEIQGDHRDAIVRELESHGYTVKLAGG